MMPTLNLSEVSKQFKVNRSTIYRAVSSGRLSRRADGSFDLAEVIRCFGEPVATQQPKQQHVNQVEHQSNQDQAKIIELLQKELQQYRDREERLLNQIDRMQTLIEMKSPPVADTVSQQQPQATEKDNSNAISETIENKDIGLNATLQATPQQQAIESLSNIASATQQHEKKRPGLLGRLVRAVLD